MRQLLLIAAIIAVFLLLRRWLKQRAATSLKELLYIIVAVVAVLALLGKLHWLAALGAGIMGALPVILKKALLVLRYLPMLGAFMSRSGYGKSGNARFQTAWLRLEINPVLGTLDGEVLQGTFKQRRLSSMSLEELRQLHETLLTEDRKSALLIQNYLALRSRTRQTRRDDASAYANEPMTHEEALNVLGLQAGAPHADIIRAYKRLMQKIHPDRGGSSYLAAKINQAKDTLLKK